jgi:hypothetical protein
MSTAGDNKDMNTSKAFVQQAQFASAVSEVEQMLLPEVVRIRYTLGNDWTGEPAVFFKIVLTDAASSRINFGK